MSKKILIVDDSATMIMSLKTNLEMHKLDVESAADGQEALDKLKAGLKPDLIITDINMPRMTGLELIKHARALYRFVPIIALTTESQGNIRDEAKANGATGWLVKPISGADLIKIVKQVVPGV